MIKENYALDVFEDNLLGLFSRPRLNFDYGRSYNYKIEDGKLSLQVGLIGKSKDDVDISFQDDGVLTISADGIEKKFRIPAAYDLSTSTASMKGGLLSISIDEKKRKRTKIKWIE